MYDWLILSLCFNSFPEFQFYSMSINGALIEAASLVLSFRIIEHQQLCQTLLPNLRYTHRQKLFLNLMTIVIMDLMTLGSDTPANSNLLLQDCRMTENLIVKKAYEKLSIKIRNCLFVPSEDAQEFGKPQLGPTYML